MQSCVHWLKKKKLFILLFLIAAYCHACAQNNDVNSSIFSTLGPSISEYASDTAYINKLVIQGTKYEYQDSATAIYLKTLGLSKAINYQKGIIVSLVDLGVYEQDDEKGIAYYLLALSYCNQWDTNDTAVFQMRSSIYHNIALKYFYKGQYGTCAYYNYKVLEIAQQYTLPKHLVFDTYTNLGNVWAKIGDATQAMYYYNIAENIIKVYKDTLYLANLWRNMSTLYLDKNDIEKSKYYSSKVLALLKQIQVNTFDQALKNSIIYYIELNLATDEINENKPREAIAHITSILQDKHTVTDNRLQINAYYVLGAAYYLLKDYKRAEKYVLPALQKAQEKGLMDNVTNAYTLLTSIDSATGRFEKAYKYERSYMLFKDSLIEKNKKKINDMEMADRATKNDRQLIQKELVITRQENNLDKKNAWIAGISIFTLLLVILSVFMYKNIQHKQQMLRQEQEVRELKALIKGEERERIRIGRELHDGVGGLLSIAKINFSSIVRRNQVLTETEDFKNILSLIDDATNELRKTTHDLIPETLLYGGLEKALMSFCNRIPKENTLEIEVHNYGTPCQLNNSLALSLFRILQELIHNVIKHAQATHAIVQLNWQGEQLNIIVEDNGIGMTTNTQNPGIGLNNIEARVRLLEGHIEIDSSMSNGTTVCLAFPLKNGLTV